MQPYGREVPSPHAGGRHITFLVYSSFPCYSGGRENWLFNIVATLSRRGVSTTIYSCASGDPVFHDLSGCDNVRLVRIPALQGSSRLFAWINRFTLNFAFWLAALLWIGRTAAALRRDWTGGPVVALNPIIDLSPALRAKREARMPVVCSVRGMAAWELSLRSPGTGPFLRWTAPLMRRLEKLSLSRCDVVLANGYDTQEYLDTIGVASSVVPNGVDFERFAGEVTFDSEVRPLQDWAAAGKAIILSVATLRRVKGVYDLLEAASVLRSRGVLDFVIVMVGKGEQWRYRRRARHLNLEDNVWFAGEQRNVPAFLRLADISANLSGGAGMSMSALEAMAAAKAIVAWDTPVYRQLIRDGSSGLLARQGSSTDLADKLYVLIEDAQLRERLGAQAQREAKAYDWSAVADRLLEAVWPRVPSET